MKGWNYPACGGEKCKKGVVQKNGSFGGQACENAVDYPVLRIAPEEAVDVDSKSRNMNTSAKVNITKVKRLATKPSVTTPSMPTEERRKREELEDSDDEVIGDMDDGGVDRKESSLKDKRKKRGATIAHT
nr:hypothetical protein [Tanacetum cinerariifolium]